MSVNNRSRGGASQSPSSESHQITSIDMNKKFFLLSDIMALKRRIQHLETENHTLASENAYIKGQVTAKEQSLIDSLQEENHSLSRSIVESNHQQEAMEAQIVSLQRANEGLLSQKSDLEEQLFAALQQLNHPKMTPPPVFSLSDSARKA